MAISLKRKHSKEIKTGTKTNVEKSDVLIKKDRKKYLKPKKRLVKGRSINQGSGLMKRNINYCISYPTMTSYNNDNSQTPESNNNRGVVAEWRPHPNVYHPPRLPVAFVAPQMRTRYPYQRALITSDPLVPSVGQPIMVPEVRPNFCPYSHGYTWTHKVPYIQETSVQDPNIQEHYIHQSYLQYPYTQQPYVQHPYVHCPYAQPPYAQQRYVQQPYAQQPYAQQPYVQEPSTPSSSTQELGYYLEEHQEPCMQEPYLTEPYEQGSYTVDDVSNDLRKCTLEDLPSPGQTTESVIDESMHSDPFEAYLNLPKDLFPTATKLGLDPNPFIDQFCKLEDVIDNTPWILDLELGVPVALTTRTMAIYDIKTKSIRCKHEPNIIHPGFQRCNSDFQKSILKYYDYIVHSWYEGYKKFYNEKSLQNFEAWLLLPMHMFGLCWP